MTRAWHIDVPDAPPRLRFEPLLPLIDVVFFLVIAFMMMSHLTTARPFEVALPVSAQQDDAAGAFTLFVSVAGVPGLVAPEARIGEAALVALALARAAHCARADCAGSPPVLRIAADAATPASALAALLPRLGAMGFGVVRLLVTQGG